MDVEGALASGLIPDRTPIDPNQFAVSWDATIESLVLVVIVSLIVERLLSILFESKPFIEYRKKQWTENKSSNKEIIAFSVSTLVCWLYQIDILAIIMSHAHTSIVGILVTAGVVAGGSKGSIKLFRDTLGFKSSSYDEYVEHKKIERPSSGGSQNTSPAPFPTSPTPEQKP